MPDHLIPPHGGALVELLVGAERREELRALSRDWPSWDLTDRQLCDLELLLNGAFSPLRSFLGRADYESVCQRMRLADGTLWPIPVTLDVTEALARTLEAGTSVALRDPDGTMLAALHAGAVQRHGAEARTGRRTAPCRRTRRDGAWAGEGRRGCAGSSVSAG